MQRSSGGWLNEDEPPVYRRRQLPLVLAAFVFGPVWLWTISGAVMTQFGNLHLAVPLLAATLTYHGVLFLISGVLRSVCVMLAMTLHEPRASGIAHAHASHWASAPMVLSDPSKVTAIR